MEKYRINFIYKGTTLSLDELPFGFYLEIEGTASKINYVAKNLGYQKNDFIYSTYWKLFEQKKLSNNKSDNIVFPSGYKSKLIHYLKLNVY